LVSRDIQNNNTHTHTPVGGLKNFHEIMHFKSEPILMLLA